jgi:hypothetical protein
VLSGGWVAASSHSPQHQRHHSHGRITASRCRHLTCWRCMTWDSVGEHHSADRSYIDAFAEHRIIGMALAQKIPAQVEATRRAIASGLPITPTRLRPVGPC